MVMGAPFRVVPASILAAAPTGPAMRQAIDTVNPADGVTAAGSVLISWPAFTTADSNAVAAGSLTMRLGNGVAFSANLAPNTATGVRVLQSRVPAGWPATITEYWVVPVHRID